MTGEELKIKGRMDNVDPALREAMTNQEDGLLRPGALPKVAASSAAGSKQLLDVIEKAILQGGGWIYSIRMVQLTLLVGRAMTCCIFPG